MAFPKPAHTNEKSNTQVQVNSAPDTDSNNEPTIQEQKGGTKHDIHDMNRMGKR